MQRHSFPAKKGLQRPSHARKCLHREICLVLALVVCCWRPAPADHIPGLPGPYPGLLVPSATGLTVDFSTEAELIAAISNDTIKVAHLVKNLRLEAKGWPLLPILRNTSFTISGDPSPYPYPILDLAFIESKVQLAQDAVFLFKRVELRNTRQRSGFEVDLFAASPGAYVRYEDIVYHCFSCLPPSTIASVMMSQTHATLAQNVTPAAKVWCRPQPLLARCYNNTNDLDIHSASAELPVSGLQGITSGGGYVLEGTDVNFVCEEPTTFECGNAKGWDICVRQSIEDVMSRDHTWEILAAAEQHSAGQQGDDGNDSSTVAVAVGVAVGIGGGLLLLAGGAFLYMRHRRRGQQQEAAQGRDKAADAEAPLGADASGKKASDGAVADSSGHNKLAGETRAVSTSDDSNGGAVAPEFVAVAMAPAPPALAALPAVRTAAPSPHSANGNGAAGCSAAEAGSPAQSGNGSSRPRRSSACAGPKSTVVLGGVSIELDMVLGAGSFGKVFRGSWQGQSVAVKVLHYGQELCRAVHTEVLLSQALKHVNIVNSLHFAQVLPGGCLAAINVNDNAAASASTRIAGNPSASRAAAARNSAVASGPTADTAGAVAAASPATRSANTHFVEGGSKPSDKTSCSIAAGSYSRFLNTNDMANPPSAMFGSSLAAGRAAAAAAAAAADRSSRASNPRHTGGTGVVGAAGLAGALGLPVRATAALGGGGGGASDVAPLGNLRSLTRAASLPLEEIWPLLEIEEPRPTAAAAGGTTGPGSGKPRTVGKARITSASGRGRPSSRVLGKSILGPVALGAVALGAAGCMRTDQVERSSCSAPDILSGWVSMQAMRRALDGDSCSGERLPEEELMALEEGDELEEQEHDLQGQQQTQGQGHGYGAGTAAANASESGGAQPEKPPAPASDVTAVGGGSSTIEHTGCAPLSTTSNATACGTEDRHAGAAAAEATAPGDAGTMLGGILIGTPRAGGEGGEAQTPRIALPLEQLWLAAHAQPMEGSSHGFLVMELCEGGSLQSWRATQWRARNERPDMAVLLPLALDIARGMLYIHSAGVCHGDLKLANVMLARAASSAGVESASEGVAGMSRLGSLGTAGAFSGSGCAVQTPDPRSLQDGWVAKVGDFGLSRLLTTERTHVSTRPAGTISHMAPELWSKGHVSPQADVYAYGITLWELATGDKPYRGLNMARLVHRVLVSGGRPALPLWLPPAYTRLVTSCWAQSPKDRPTFAAVVQYLEMMMAALPASSRQ